MLEARKLGHGRGGVFWQTQGSGKSGAGARHLSGEVIVLDPQTAHYIFHISTIGRCQRRV